MKSTQTQLAGRGFVSPGEEDVFCFLTAEALLLLLESKLPTERTMAARLLAQKAEERAVEPLCQALLAEKKLYTKIEICNALAGFGSAALENLIPLLGRIGNNQHQTIPNKEFNKKSFPLPRDLVARVLIRMGPVAVPALVKVMESGAATQVSEALDALGYLSFYTPPINAFDHFLQCYQRFHHHPLMVWKIVRAMSACDEAREFLENLHATSQHIGIKREVDRSLKILDGRIVACSD